MPQWDYAMPDDESKLAERIRPVLNRIRHKPYGRRFLNRIAERDKKLGIHAGDSMSFHDGGLSPDSFTSATIASSYQHSHTTSHDSTGLMSSNSGFSGIGSPSYTPQSIATNAGFPPPRSHRFSNPSGAPPMAYQHQGQNDYSQYARVNQQNGMTFF